jgi:hypothetical protein
VLSLASALVGVIHPAIYEGVVPPYIIPAVFTQDILVIVAAVLLLILTAVTGRSRLRGQIVILGILGFPLYALARLSRVNPNRSEYTFSVHIIDLCFIMPAFVICAVMAIREKALGEVWLPSILRV